MNDMNIDDFIIWGFFSKRDEELVETINLIVDTYDCKVTKLDLQNYEIAIEGPFEAEAQCAFAIDVAVRKLSFRKGKVCQIQGSKY